MGLSENVMDIEELKKTYPEKFLPPERVFGSIHAGDSIFIGTGCGEPQYLVRTLRYGTWVSPPSRMNG